MLKFSYTLITPIYDLVVSRATRALRINSFRELEKLSSENDRVLIMGIGTGLDIPHLPPGLDYVGIDLTPSMLSSAKQRSASIDIKLDEGDVMNMPYESNSFDQVVMHLILAVVPNPRSALEEAIRVLKPGGHIFILDKFLQPGQLAPIRRLANPIIKHIATQTNVTFEKLMDDSQLELVKNEPALANGWFRYIVVKKKETE